MEGARLSPYVAVFGDALEELHPRLREYFGAIPAGHHGWGAGCFDRVGTPRRWLWPALRLFQREGVLLSGWHSDVPFTILNTPGVNGDGLPTVRAVRRFQFEHGPWDMVDSIEAVSGIRTQLADYLGHHRPIETVLHATVRDGALTIRSTGVAVRMAGSRVPIPALVAPSVSLLERFDDFSGKQHVAVTLSVPLLGTIYEYAGSFRYELRAGDRDICSGES